MRDRLLYFTLVFGLFAPLFLPGEGRANEPVTIRIGHGFSSEEQLWLMKAMPQVATNVGKVYNLAFTAFRSSETRFKAFESGQLDAGTASAYSLLFAVSKGIHLTVVASISKESDKGFPAQFFVLIDSPIKTVTDLKDRTIAINGYQSSDQLWARSAIIAAGLNPEKDVKWALVPFPNMGEALRSRRIDTAGFSQPYASAEQERGGVRSLFNSRTYLPFDEEQQLVYFQPAFLKKNPKAVGAFVADLVQATNYYLAETTKAKQSLLDAKMVSLKPELYLHMPDSYRDPTCRPSVEQLEKQQDLMISTGYMKSKLDIPGFIDASFLPK
jgi:ABC-type nitrate/sulfonate/bicarbonate transport system substrate-binding protein